MRASSLDQASNFPRTKSDLKHYNQATDVIPVAFIGSTIHDMYQTHCNHPVLLLFEAIDQKSFHVHQRDFPRKVLQDILCFWPEL